ncbi:MAG: UDP-N-acetylmuramoylalanyl-D-glutamyl-2, 6-diaminopimelate--D-alanyl-D-alanine ligase [Phenylobacterium zucineum]|nr:MAG: UDP-N-acetylmuramoylalanyl-D-glutamyl-2, 6-diaminopimelate--D-alanyl-D-alanine ligase [Phenylobacterium zucineum]
MTEALWTAQEIAAATGGRVTTAFAADGVSIDTRTLASGDLFVALAGARDGHDFVAQALDHGAAGVLASQPVGGPSVQVADTFKALEALGLAARLRAPQVRRGAVTGSVGKTSVTQAIRAGLILAGRTHSSIKSYNNHIGVPLTLARMPRDSDRAIFEIGMNHADEIAPLSRMVAPHAVAITTVGPVHVENFPEGERGVARAKAEVFQGMAPGGVAVLNADNTWFEFLSSEARKAGLQVQAFGTDSTCAAQLVSFEPQNGYAQVKARLQGRALDFPIRQTGFHWGPNSLAVLLMLEALDVSLDHGLQALAAFQPLEGRGAESLVNLVGGTFTLVDESYNANPISMTAALLSLGARRTDGRRIVALTDMLELGDGGRNYHAALAEPLAKAEIDLVFCAGPFMKSLWDALPPTQRGGYALTAVDLAQQVAQAIEPGDLVMVKGSLGSKAGIIAEKLGALGLGPEERR